MLPKYKQKSLSSPQTTKQQPMDTKLQVFNLVKGVFLGGYGGVVMEMKRRMG